MTTFKTSNFRWVRKIEVQYHYKIILLLPTSAYMATFHNLFIFISRVISQEFLLRQKLSNLFILSYDFVRTTAAGQPTLFPEYINTDADNKQDMVCDLYTKSTQVLICQILENITHPIEFYYNVLKLLNK